MKKELQTFGASLAVGTVGLMTGSAAAVTLPPTATVTVHSTTYNVTFFTGDYDSNSSRFTTTEMPWWGDSFLAEVFATAVGTQLGLIHNSTMGPFFAYSDTPAFHPILGNINTILQFTYETSTNNASFITSDSFVSLSYAVLSPQTPAPVPAPLPILGAAAAFGATKRLRGLSRRLHRSTTEIS